MSDRRTLIAPELTAVSPAARLLTLESRLSRRATELPLRAMPATVIGTEREWDQARSALRRQLRAAWAAGQHGGRPFAEQIAAAATAALPAWAAARLIAYEAAAIVAEASGGLLTEVLRTVGDTARAYVLDAHRLGLPEGGIVSVGVAVSARVETIALRRRASALRTVGERARALLLSDARRLTPATRLRLADTPLRTLMVVQTMTAATTVIDRTAVDLDGVLIVDAAGRIDLDASTPEVAQRLLQVTRGRASGRAVHAAQIIGEPATGLTPALR